MKLVVLGGGESGVGAALLGRHLGYEVFLSDKGKLAESYRDELITHRIAFEEGQHSMDRIFAAELVVKSPGIPDTVPMVVALRERGIEVISEIEFAGRHTEAKMVCITGSNGKTTDGTGMYVGRGRNVTNSRHSFDSMGLWVGICPVVMQPFALRGL